MRMLTTGHLSALPTQAPIRIMHAIAGAETNSQYMKERKPFNGKKEQFHFRGTRGR